MIGTPASTATIEPAKFVTRTIGTVSDAPALAFTAAAVNVAERSFGVITANTPAASALQASTEIARIGHAVQKQ